MRISDWSSDVCSSDLAAVEHAGALDEVAKLANIARPVVPHQQFHRSFVEAAFCVGGHLALKLADQGGKILGAAGQAGDLKHNHAEPEEKDFADLARGCRSAPTVRESPNTNEINHG